MPEKKTSSPESWKKELKWFGAALVLSIVFVGLLTRFEFGLIAIGQDSFYHFHPVKAVIYLAAFLLTLKNGVSIVGLILQKAPVMGFIFALIVPILTLLSVYVFYQRALVVHDQQAVEIARNQMWLMGMFITVLTLIEVRILLGVRKFLGGNYRSE